MILIDIGNTNTKVIKWSGKKFSGLTILKSNHDTARECKSVIDSLKDNEVVISSVVPAITKGLLKFNPFIIDNGQKAKHVLKMVNSRELGADRACNAVAALKEYGPSIIIGLGTATTFDAIDGGGYKGGSIASGLVTSLNALTGKAALLSEVGLEDIDHPLGMNTTEQLCIGALHGHAGMIDRLVEEMKDALEKNFKVIATGGLANTIKKHSKSIELVDDYLTLKGCRDIYEDSIHGKQGKR